MNAFLQLLDTGRTLIADGATGTNLQRMGLPAGTAPEDLVFDQPDLLLTLEKAFLSAGSDIILTCTFGGTRLRLKDSKYADRVIELNQRAAELACQAAQSRPDALVGGSLGPTGQLMKPYGPLSPEAARETYAEQAQALAEGGVDLLVLETLFSYDEADAAVDGVRSVTDLPLVVSFSYDRGTRTMMGVKPAEMISHYREKGAALVGANCGTSLDAMEKIAAEYSAAQPGFPLWIKPNAGLPRMEAGGAVYDITPDEMAEYTLRFTALGARVVGGCCGTSPEHLAAIAAAVR